MVFNSLEFAIFFPIVLALYYALGRKLRNLLLLTAGYVFYGFWDVRFLYLVSVSTVLDYCTGLMIGKGRMTRAQRLAPSAHVIGFALAFLVPDWRCVSWQDRWVVDVPGLLTPTTFGLRVLGLTTAVVALAHALYPALVRLPAAKRRWLFLRLSLFGQLSMLGVFKYYNFFVSSADALANHIGFSADVLHLNIILPIGISFYTFQTLSYVLDVYWGKMGPVEKLADFSLFVSYFPPLVAGPIERASHLVPRVVADRRVSLNQVRRGSVLIMLGLFKKVAIADGLATSVASVYNSTGNVSGLDVAVATVAFAAQIYCDFSGYSDIARGVSLWFGIDLLINFDLPYFSINPSEFWRRWHISLSSWLRDYLYIPLGGSKSGTYRNLMITMVLGGLWHGAAWNFVLWGTYQGILLVGHRLLIGPKATPWQGSLLARLPRMAFFFVFVCYGWLLFRGNSVEQILHFTNLLFTHLPSMALHMRAPPLSALLGIPVLLALEVWEFKVGNPMYYAAWSPFARGALYATLFALFMCGTSNETQQFIYFQF